MVNYCQKSFKKQTKSKVFLKAFEGNRSSIFTIYTFDTNLGNSSKNIQYFTSKKIIIILQKIIITILFCKLLSKSIEKPHKF